MQAAVVKCKLRLVLKAKHLYKHATWDYFPDVHRGMWARDEAGTITLVEIGLKCPE